MIRRAVALGVALVIPAGVMVWAIRSAPPAATQPTFAQLASPSMPFVPGTGLLNSTWSCPGVPTSGDGQGGAVTIANPLDTPLRGRITAFTSEVGSGPVMRSFDVAPRATYTAELKELQPVGDFASAMVELSGGGGFVEQLARHADGDAVSPCANSTSNRWYFADNYTMGDSLEDLVITNPYPDDAIVNLTFATPEQTRSPNALQGLPVPGQSILVIDETKLLKDEAVYSITVEASRGTVLAARAALYRGERRGFSLSLGAPALSTQWSFAGGYKDGTNFERISLYNPGIEDSQVVPLYFGVDNESFSPAREAITVPAGRVVSYTFDNVPDLPLGRHGIAFSSLNEVPFVVEMAVTRKDTGAAVTTVVMGVEDYFTHPGSLRWSMAIGPTVAAPQGLLVMNLAYGEATVAVKALGPGGEVDVPGLSAVKVPANGVVAIDIPQVASAMGNPLVVVADQPVIVQRDLPRGHGLLGTSASLALPG